MKIRGVARNKWLLICLLRFWFDISNYSINAVLEYSRSFFYHSQLLHSSDGSITVDPKMTVFDVVLKRWTVIKFLVAEGEKLTCIHKHLLKVCVVNLLCTWVVVLCCSYCLKTSVSLINWYVAIVTNCCEVRNLGPSYWTWHQEAISTKVQHDISR